MLIGAMNHPAREILAELEWMRDLQLDFIDLTLEPPAAAVWKVNARELASALSDHGLGVVGHTAYYLPIASPFEGIRRATLEELKRCVEVFAVLGAKWMNVHPDPHAPLHSRSVVIERNLLTLSELLRVAQDCGVGIMVENLPGSFNTVSQLSELLDPFPELGLHLDIGHANLMVQENTAGSIMGAFGQRLAHVHLHDNKGGQADLHLPLGTGTVDVAGHLQTLRTHGYDGTITLEVFSPDRRHLAYSRDVVRKLWSEFSAPMQAVPI